MMKKTTLLQAEGMTYTTTMTFFVKATSAPKPKTETIQPVSLALAGVFILIAVAQLFTFEKFSSVITNMWIVGGDAFAPVWAAIIVTLEVTAVPFLFMMQLSPAARFVSMVAGWLSIALWLGIFIWQNTEHAVVANSGILGDTLRVPPGWWSVLFMVALGVLAAWSAWGMWPVRAVHK